MTSLFRRRIRILADDDDDDDDDDDNRSADVDDLDSNTDKTKRSLVWCLAIIALVVATHLTLTGTEDNGSDDWQSYDDQAVLEPSRPAKWSRRIKPHGHGTVRFARHFALQWKPESKKSGGSSGGGGGDGGSDDDGSENVDTELFTYFGFREQLVSPGHFVTFNATPAGPNLALSSLGVGTGSSQRKVDYRTAIEKTDHLMEDAIVASVRSGWNVIDTSIHHRQQRGERCVGRALRRLCGGGGGLDFHHAYGRSDEATVRQPLSPACRLSLFLASKAGFIPGDADSEDPPRAKKAWIDNLLRHHINDDHAHGSTSSLLRFERADIAENSHCISPACLKVSLQRSIANIFGSLGPAASLDIYYLDSAAEMQLPMIYKRLAHPGSSIPSRSSSGHDDAEKRQVGVTLFLERLRRSFVFLERARLVGYADPMFTGGFNVTQAFGAVSPPPTVTAADSSPSAAAAAAAAAATTTAASYSGYHGDVSLIHFYGMATSKCFRVPPSHELYVPLRAVVKVAESAHAFVLNSSTSAQRRAHIEPALRHHGFRFIQVPVNLGMHEVATELWQPSEDGSSNLHTLLEAAALLGVHVTASQSVGLGGHRKLDDGVGCEAFRAVEINFAEPLLLQEKLDRAKQQEEDEQRRWAGHAKTEITTDPDATLQLRAWRASIGSKRGSKGSRRLQLTRSTPGLTTAIAVHKTPKHVEANTALASIPPFSAADYEDIREQCS